MAKKDELQQQAAPQAAPQPNYPINANSGAKEAALRTVGMDGQPDIMQEFFRVMADPNYKVRPMGMPYTGVGYQNNQPQQQQTIQQEAPVTTAEALSPVAKWLDAQKQRGSVPAQQANDGFSRPTYARNPALIMAPRGKY